MEISEGVEDLSEKPAKPAKLAKPYAQRLRDPFLRRRHRGCTIAHAKVPQLLHVLGTKGFHSTNVKSLRVSARSSDGACKAEMLLAAWVRRLQRLEHQLLSKECAN